MTGPPEFWFLLCQSLFQTGQELAGRLWEHIPNRGAVAWQLQVMQARGRDSRVVEDRTRRLAQALTPRALLAASLALEPEGQPRSEAVRIFENSVLSITSPDGTWHW